MNYAEAIKYLYELQLHGIKLGLDNPRRLMSALGNPELDFRSIHVAGTNGKGSVSAMLEALLGARGLRTGLFTSPHLVSFTERIRCSGMEVSPDDIVSMTREVREAARAGGLNPTFFEAVTALGFIHFSRRSVQWAVIETGMGGRLDATNVIAPGVSILTRIGMDHAEFLGRTLAEIAAEKAGIIKQGAPVVSAPQSPEALAQIESAALRAGAPLHLHGRDFHAILVGKGPGWVVFDYESPDGTASALRVSLAGAHQAMNAALALRAFELTQGPLGDTEPVRAALAGLSWPGRMERIHEAPDVYIDGGHNPEAIEALVRTVREDYLPRMDGGLTLVIGAMGDKDVGAIVGPLLGIAEEVIFTAPEFERAAPPERLAGYAEASGFANYSMVRPVAAALEAAMGRGRTVLVAGSFYTAGAAREAIFGRGFEIGLRE